MFNETIDFIREIYKTDSIIPLHEPRFDGNEKKYVLDAIDSTFVSSNGEYIDLFESQLAKFSGAKYAIAIVNGTSALHLALRLCGVQENDEVITQSLSFVATSNSIAYCNADPLFIDVNLETLGLCPVKLEEFLKKNAKIGSDGFCSNKITGKRIKACVPMHTFGHPVKIDEIIEVCDRYKIDVIEDAAESIGSYFKSKHTGTFGKVGVFSFNGNKTITAGGGGAIITDNEEIAFLAKHLSTTAKIKHQWEYRHDYVGFNYRMPNLNAALLCAQMEQLDNILINKRTLANQYSDFFENIDGIDFIKEPANCDSNYWLNGLIFRKSSDRDFFLEESNKKGIMTRPIWVLNSKLKMFRDCYRGPLIDSKKLADSVVNIPSSVRS